ncbi:MAG: hypothetical protein MJY86_00520 [Bacteroidales bacterium]|nr:hypothetical protein [Bacteroidales bacterium]
MLRRWLAYSILLLASVCLSAQQKEKTDSLVRLLGCDQLQQVEENGYSYRKALGHARFEHNSTLLVCDTAIWNVNTNIINAFGNVRIIQNETVLSSDKLDYLIDEDLAKFRGTLVQLQDKQRNTLRTRDLDYNTKDSVANFRGGASMRDKDGQIIESKYGTYDSKIKTFKFTGTVNMYTDSVFVKTELLEYDTEANMAVFGHGTLAWKDDNMLSSNAGWYDRNRELFLFNKKVHVMTPVQEAWADTLKYHKLTNDAELFGNAELKDTSRNICALAGYMSYVDSLSYIKMTRNPVVIAVSEDGGQRDTVYVGADSLKYWTVKMCDIPEGEVKTAKKRLDEISADAVTSYRQKAAADAKAAAEEAKKKMLEDDPNALGASDRGAGKGRAAKGDAAKESGKSPSRSGTDSKPASSGTPLPPREGSSTKGGQRTLRTGRAVAPNLPAPWDDLDEVEFPEYSFKRQTPDTLRRSGGDSLLTPGKDSTLLSGRDSTKAGADSLVVKDTTKIGYLLALGGVKVFRKDMQVVCDSLAYSDLDSLVRLFQSPIIWNETNRQYTADSIRVMIKNKALEKASLMSNAFILIQEDTVCYDQIKGAEMMAYFDSTGALSRFDSMGGASGLFFIEENGSFATVNKFEAKMLTATFLEGNINDLNYFQEAKTDAYPFVQLKRDERRLKGFDWQPDKRPKQPSDVTSFVPRKSERERYEAMNRPEYNYTADYFPGYMNSVYKMLARQDSLKDVRAAERRRLKALQEQEERERADSLNAAESALREKLDSELADSGENEVSSGESEPEEKVAKTPERKKPAERENNPETSDQSRTEEPPKTEEAAVESVQEETEPQLSAEEEARRLKEEKAAEAARLKAERKAERQAAREAKVAAREAHWAELDARDAAKAEEKAQKALVRKRKSTAKAVQARDKREAKEQSVLEYYMARFEKRKARQEARSAGKNK